MLNPHYNITIINYESLHKVSHETRWDMIVCDEAHSMGAFPKPSLRAKTVKSLLQIHNPYVILLSGTPTPESYSQMYHQVYGIQTNPFREHINFYKFSKQYVNVTQKKIGALSINDYSNGLPSILDVMKPYTIAYTQKEAGFKVNTDEEILFVEVSGLTHTLIHELKTNLVVEGKDNVILADTAVKLMSKIHQMCSGTVKFESGDSMVFDLSKAEYIKKKFKNTKIAIFYKFKEELNALKKVFKKSLCTELEDFNNTNKNIALQIVSGREGISLKNAQALV
jgi:SNF2 family DNA or RNA helicase